MKSMNKKPKASPLQLQRTKKAQFMLNEEEYKLISFYLNKYKISNRSRWFRETVVSHILKSLDKDYPTLFDENEMRR
ncbi:MAG: hypothetical protein BGN96_07200 [Bacteroidales bacterium 45-6]|nr:MAG: hypothetical protein BGN96_07200 [Bacteroidales bacterium 45-6]